MSRLTVDRSQAAVAAEKAAAAFRDATREKTAAEEGLQLTRMADQRVTQAWERFERDSQLSAHLTGFQQHFFAANTREVIARASRLIQRVADSSIRGIALDQNGTLYYRDASYVKRPIDRLSGGEKALVGLCLWAGPKVWTVSSRGLAQEQGTTWALPAYPGDGLTSTFAVLCPQRGAAGRPLAC